MPEVITYEGIFQGTLSPFDVSAKKNANFKSQMYEVLRGGVYEFCERNE